MRCVAGVGWLLLVGCNRVFGIAATQPWDAPPDVVADMPHVVLTWQLATTAATGGPSPALAYPPFTGGKIPQVRIARLDGDFTPVAYSSGTGAGSGSDAGTGSGSGSGDGREGWIDVPRDYFDGRWRLEYTFPGGVPHEIQWEPEDKVGHLTVPMVGRLERPTAPIGGGYTVSPSGFAGPYTFPQMFSTGLWTAGGVDLPATGVTIDYDYFNATSLSGDKGRPDPTSGDRASLVDFAFDTSTNSITGIKCRAATGSAALTSVAIASGTHTVQSAPWDAARSAVMTDSVGLPFIERLTTGLGKLHGAFEGKLSWLLFGAVPSIEFPGLTGTAAPSANIHLPIPVMQVLFQCPYDASPIPLTARPAQLADFPAVVHAQLVDSRSALGVTLRSGIETVIASSGGDTYRMAFPAAMPTRITLTTPSGTLDLSGDTDQLAAGPATGAFTLAFVPETGADLRADYHDVILHRIVGTDLTVDRIYTTAAPTVRIDGALLVPGADYVFEIRSYKGHVTTKVGNFAPVDYPYGSAIVFTRTFKTSP